MRQTFYIYLIYIIRVLLHHIVDCHKDLVELFNIVKIAARACHFIATEQVRLAGKIIVHGFPNVVLKDLKKLVAQRLKHKLKLF